MDKEKWTGETDADLDARKIIFFMAGMAAAIGICTALVFAYGGALTKSLVATDPRPSHIRVAPGEKLAPRGPILQKSPAADMAAMNREQDEVLSSYGWVDRPAGIARIPIDRAIELAVVPSVPAAASAAPAAGPSAAPATAAAPASVSSLESHPDPASPAEAKP